MTEKAEQIIKRIDEELRELAKETGVYHISASFIKGTVMIDDLSNIGNQEFSYYNKEESK